MIFVIYSSWKISFGVARVLELRSSILDRILLDEFFDRASTTMYPTPLNVSEYIELYQDERLTTQIRKYRSLTLPLNEFIYEMHHQPF